MKKYLVSRTSNANFALAEYSIEEVSNTAEEAEKCAVELTRESSEAHFVFEVDLKVILAARLTRSVEVKNFDAAL